MGRSREAILDAAAAVLAGNPGASLGDVVARAGVSRATLHREFNSRDALIRAVALRSIRELDAEQPVLEPEGADAQLRECVCVAFGLARDGAHELGDAVDSTRLVRARG